MAQRRSPRALLRPPARGDRTRLLEARGLGEEGSLHSRTFIHTPHEDLWVTVRMREHISPGPWMESGQKSQRLVVIGHSQMQL